MNSNGVRPSPTPRRYLALTEHAYHHPMRTRQEIDTMLGRLRAEVPALLTNPNGFLPEFKCRAMLILGETAPGDEAYVQAALEDLIVQSGINV